VGLFLPRGGSRPLSAVEKWHWRGFDDAVVSGLDEQHRLRGLGVHSTIRPVSIVLRPMSPSAAQAIQAGRTPEDVRVAPDYPTEFSRGIAQSVGKGSPLGPYFIHCPEDDLVLGEIDAGFVSPGLVEIGYALVPSCWGQGYATDAVRTLVSLARQVPEIVRMIAPTPLDRPTSGRVLEKAGFRLVGETEDEHEGTVVRVQRWELRLLT
jgi:RimJ/RimL family protein N-acetyltransferase